MTNHDHQLSRAHSFDNNLISSPLVAVAFRSASTTDIQVYQPIGSGPMISIVSTFCHPCTGSMNRIVPTFRKSESAEHLERSHSLREITQSVKSVVNLRERISTDERLSELADQFLTAASQQTPKHFPVDVFTHEPPTTVANREVNSPRMLARKLKPSFNAVRAVCLWWIHSRFSTTR